MTVVSSGCEICVNVCLIVYIRERMHLYVQRVCVCMQDLLNLGVHVACLCDKRTGAGI